MPIYKAAICLFFLFALPLCANSANVEQFLESHGATSDIAKRMLSGTVSLKGCAAYDGWLLCYEGRNYPNSAKNAQARQGISAGLGISVRNALYLDLAARVRAAGLINRQAVGQALLATQNRGDNALTGLEFTSYCRDDWCGAAAALPLSENEKSLPAIYARRPFIMEYCRTLLPEAQKLMAEKRHKEALIALKELHDLKFANIEAYLLAVEAFIANRQNEDAAKIAIELLDDFSGKMSVEEAETLGDLFMTLQMQDRAENAYLLASRLLTSGK